MESQSTTASFGYWVKRRRLALDLTQAALAQEVGCATVTIKKIEYDERRPSPQMATRLAECLAVPEAERERFMAAALQERPVDTLPLPDTPLAPTPGWLAEAEQPAGAETLFVGREQELARLETVLAQSLAGHTSVYFVTGEAGRGKTALLAHFAQRASEASAELVVVWGSCTAAGRGDPYLPFRDLLVSLAGDVEGSWSSGRLTREQASRLWAFAPEVARAVWAVAPQLVDALVPATNLQRWLTPPPGHPPQEEPDSKQQSQLFAQLTALLEQLAKQRPLLLVLDDLQWADRASLSLLFHLGRRLQRSPVMLLGAYRPTEATAGTESSDLELPDVVRELARREGDITINLDHFDLAQERRFVDGVLDSEPNRLDEDFRIRFFWRTRGHPLFTVELLHEMRAHGALEQDEAGVWVASETIDWEAIPARVEAVIARRIDRVPPALRELLAVASVEGDSFTAQVVAEVQGVGEREVFRYLAMLSNEYGLVREQGEQASGDRWLARYQFSHILFQQYLYQHLGHAERRHLHAMVGEALERLYGISSEAALDRSHGPLLSQLAQHAAEAGDDEKAASYLIRLGDWARTLYANAEAVVYYERALVLLRRHEGKGNNAASIASVLIKMGLAHQTAFDYSQAQQAFDSAFSLLPARRHGQVAPLPARSPTRAAAPHPLRLLWQDPPSLDPTLGGYNLTAPVANQLFSGLVSFGPENEILPDVAYRWEISADGRDYLFHLRDDVFWSDGRPVTAHDFLFTYRRALDPATKAPVAGQLLYAVKGAEEYHQGEHDQVESVGLRALGDYTLAFTLAEPASYFIHNLAYYVLLPVPRHVVAHDRDSWAKAGRIVTNGPFQLAEWEPGQQMLLEHNPRYHGTFAGNLQQVHLTLNEPPSAQVALYEAGELDVASTWFGTNEEIAWLRQRFPAEYVRRLSFVTTYFFLDVTRAPLDVKAVRQALVMALDREALAGRLMQGMVTAATGGFVPPGMPGHLAGCALEHDPAGARRRLAGSRDGATIPLTIVTYARRHELARFLQESWQQALGIEVAVALVDPADFWEEVKHHDAPVAVGGWWADYPDPDNFLRVNIALDLPQWQHEGYQELLARAARRTDQGERLRLYEQAERILAEEAVLVPLYYTPFHLMLKPWVKRYPTSAVKNPGFWKDVVIERDGRS
jgi:ABC-type oligopeptide transport system substrate-binding subunit/transcriptional regulator with XRE-family HTH domain